MMPGRWVTVNGQAVYIEETSRGTVVAKPTRRRTNPLRESYRQQQARDREREKERKAATRYAVFPHAIDGKVNRQGGHVVRATDESGEPHDRRNYGGVSRVGKLYVSEKAAQKAADRMGA